MLNIDKQLGLVDIHTPGSSVNSTFNGDIFESQVSTPLFDKSIDVDSAITDATGIPMNGRVLGLINYSILDSELEIKSGIDQSFSFDPTLMVSLTDENGGVSSFKVGDSMDFIMPDYATDLTPTFWMDNTFVNNTGIDITPYLSISALSLNVSHIGGIGPLYRNTLSSTYGIPIYNNSFTLEGFDSYTAQNFEIRPIPEPTTMLLFGTGIIGLAGIRRRRKKE